MPFRSRVLEHIPPKPVDFIPYVGAAAYGIRSLKALRKIMTDPQLDLVPGKFVQTKEIAIYGTYLIALMGYNTLCSEAVQRALEYLSR